MIAIVAAAVVFLALSALTGAMIFDILHPVDYNGSWFQFGDDP